MKGGKKLVVATYNIQFSKHPDNIIKNIVRMSEKGVTLFCLQEVIAYSDSEFIINRLTTALGKEWRSINFLGEKNSFLGMGNSIIWNSEAVTLQKNEKLLLPKSKSLSLPEKIFSWFAGGITATFQRRTVIAEFSLDKEKFRIVNLHLDHNGGISNRKKQLLFLMHHLKSLEEVSHEIICGDFNSFDLLRTGTENLMHDEVLGEEFFDASKDSGWTANLNDIDIHYGKAFLTFIIKRFHLHIRRKLDYIWIKNLDLINCQKLQLKGSDHLPLIATLRLE